MNDERIAAFVLAAGFGTRLRPLTEDVPKPLVPIVGVPMLSWALALLAQSGFKRAIVNAHYLGDQLATWEGAHHGVEVVISAERPDILGTGGGLKFVEEKLADRFVVVNADILCDIDLKALLEAVPDGGASMALRRSKDIDKYGVVAADEEGVVVKLSAVARAEPVGSVDSKTHFTGVHAMSRDALRLVPSEFSCVVRTAYKELVPKRAVAATVHSGVWLDVGDPVAYLEANIEVMEGRGPKHLNPMLIAGWSRDHVGAERGNAALVMGCRINGPCFVGQGAMIGKNTAITRSVVGAGATIASGCVMRDCVVWDGVSVPPGVHTRTIFYSDSENTVA